MVDHGRADRLAAVQRDRVVVPGGRGPVGLGLQMMRRRQRDFALRTGVYRLALFERLDAKAAERRLLQCQITLGQQPEIEVDHVHALLLAGADCGRFFDQRRAFGHPVVAGFDHRVLRIGGDGFQAAVGDHAILGRRELAPAPEVGRDF